MFPNKSCVFSGHLVWKCCLKVFSDARDWSNIQLPPYSLTILMFVLPPDVSEIPIVHVASRYSLGLLNVYSGVLKPPNKCRCMLPTVLTLPFLYVCCLQMSCMYSGNSMCVLPSDDHPHVCVAFRFSQRYSHVHSIVVIWQVFCILSTRVPRQVLHIIWPPSVYVASRCFLTILICMLPQDRCTLHILIYVLPPDITQQVSYMFSGHLVCMLLLDVLLCYD